METAISIIGGLITLIGIAYPVYSKIKGLNEKANKKVHTAKDNNMRHTFIERMRNRNKS